MSRLEYTIWLIPWILFTLSCFGLALIGSELVMVWATGECWLPADLIPRIGFISGAYFLFFTITHIMSKFLNNQPE